MLQRAALVVGAALATAAPAAAQSAGSASELTGRWAVTLEGGAPPRVRGELRLRDSAGSVTGTIFLATHDTTPVPIEDATLTDGRLEFLAGFDPGLRFVGRVNAGTIAGDAFGGAGEQVRTWQAIRIADQIEFYASLPRFRLRQTVAGLAESTVRLPGAWVAAAHRSGFVVDSLGAEYASAAAAAGLQVLPAAALPADGGPYLLGVHRRDETSAALRAALERIDADLPTPALRAKFRQLFRSRDGSWLTDMHAVALDRARRRSPAIEWNDARAALRAAGWITDEAPTDEGTLPFALYRLARLEQADTVQFRLLDERLALEPNSARAVRLLLEGYEEGSAWYPEALGFLLASPWVRPAGEAQPQSIATLMGRLWGGEVAVPELRTAYFGYPQAVPRYGTPDALTDELLIPENWTAREWLARNGRLRLLTIARRLGADSLVPTIIERDGRSFRLTTARRRAEESVNGFLEGSDAIVADPGVPPLLALGTVVHEWQHLAYERARWSTSGDARPAVLDSVTGTVALRATEPVIAEGVAEWAAALILAPAVSRHPIIGVAEPLKRARLAVMSPDDPHLVGYLLVRALATVLPPRGTVELLVEAGTDPGRVMASASVSRAWRGLAGAPDRLLNRGAALALIPETLFTIDGGWPDPIAARIRF